MKNDLSSILLISGPLNLIMQHTDQNNRMDTLDLPQLFSKVYEKRKLILTVTAATRHARLKTEACSPYMDSSFFASKKPMKNEVFASAYPTIH